MFFALAIFSMLGYAVQLTLMASIYRRLDPLSSAALRGVSLGITMLPLLFFVPHEALVGIVDYPLELFCAAFFAGLGNWMAAISYRHLRVGIANAVQQATVVIFVTVESALVFHETLSPNELVWVAAIVAGNFFLGLAADSHKSFTEEHFLKGAFYSTLFGLFLSVAFLAMTALSRALHPLAAGYYWEFTIGIFMLAMAFIRSRLQRRPTVRIEWKDFLKILLFSSPTAVGTGCYALAVVRGPLPLATAIISTMIVASTLLAYVVYRERLSAAQWLAMLFIVCAIIGLKLSAPVL